MNHESRPNSKTESWEGKEKLAGPGKGLGVRSQKSLQGPWLV